MLILSTTQTLVGLLSLRHQSPKKNLKPYTASNFKRKYSSAQLKVVRFHKTINNCFYWKHHCLLGKERHFWFRSRWGEREKKANYRHLTMKRRKLHLRTLVQVHKQQNQRQERMYFKVVIWDFYYKITGTLRINSHIMQTCEGG